MHACKHDKKFELGNRLRNCTRVPVLEDPGNYQANPSVAATSSSLRWPYGHQATSTGSYVRTAQVRDDPAGQQAGRAAWMQREAKSSLGACFDGC